MKKTIIFLGMLMVFSHSLWAQLQSYIEDASGSFGPTTGGSIVRNYNEEFAIGFFKDAGASYFYVVEVDSGIVPFTHGNKIAVSGGWDVKDIYINDGEAFFCGNVGVDGIVGHFPVGNLINGSGSVSVESRIIPGIPLRHLVAYGNATSYHVAAIDSTVIISCDFTTTYCFFRIIPPIYDELIYDVLLKGDTLLYVGTDTTNNCITVRISSCSNPLDVLPPWRYQPANPAIHVIPTGSIASLLPNDRLAVVHQVSNVEKKFELDLLTIQFSNMQCINRQAFVNQHRVRYHDLKYIPTTQRLELLYTDFVQFDTYVLEWQPVQNTTYLTNVLQPTLRYSSMDRIVGKYFFMVSGFHWMLQNTQSGGWSNSCETHWLANIIHEQVYDNNIGDPPLNLIYHSISPVIVNTSAVNSFNVVLGCSK